MNSNMTAVQEAELDSAIENNPRRPRSIAQQLVRLAQQEYEFFPGADGQPYALCRVGTTIAQGLRGEDSFRKQLAMRYHVSTQGVASSQALADAVRLLEAHADEAEPRPVFQRLAPNGTDSVIVDLARPDSTIVEIKADGWTIRPSRKGDPLFKRSRGMAPLPQPTPGGSLDDLWPLVNAADADRPLLKAWLVSVFLPYRTTIPTAPRRTGHRQNHRRAATDAPVRSRTRRTRCPAASRA